MYAAPATTSASIHAMFGACPPRPTKRPGSCAGTAAWQQKSGSRRGQRCKSPREAAAPPNPVDESIPDAELRQRYDALAHAFRELQAELHETNRGVVALH